MTPLEPHLNNSPGFIILEMFMARFRLWFYVASWGLFKRRQEIWGNFRQFAWALFRSFQVKSGCEESIRPKHSPTIRSKNATYFRNIGIGIGKVSYRIETPPPHPKIGKKIPPRHPNSHCSTRSKKYPQNTRKIPEKNTNFVFFWVFLFSGGGGGLLT